MSKITDALPADMVSWHECVSELIVQREALHGFFHLRGPCANQQLEHWLLIITPEKLIYRSAFVTRRPYFSEDDTTISAAAFPVRWELPLSELRTIELRTLSDFNGEHYSIVLPMGKVEVPGDTIKHITPNFSHVSDFWRAFSYTTDERQWRQHKDTNFKYDTNDFWVLYAFTADGRRLVIWQSYKGYDNQVSRHAKVLDGIERARKKGQGSSAANLARSKYL